MIIAGGLNHLELVDRESDEVHEVNELRRLEVGEEIGHERGDKRGDSRACRGQDACKCETRLGHNRQHL